MDPEAPLDVVAGSVVVEVQPGATEFSVSYQQGHQVERFAIAAAGPAPASGGNVAAAPNLPHVPAFSWSKSSNVYHHSECSVVKRISPANLQTGDQPPQDKTLHANCPLLPN
jgi:hypothetical protein